jgi:glycosyltransferase involved in cell wall biosynthesis
MFSVVIPLYNKAHTIVTTLRTVLAQTYKDFEIIIINDGSTDNSLEVINSSFSDKRIKLVSQPNGGVSSARNIGMRLSKFDYIAFLDGDDEWFPDYLLNIHAAVNKFPDAGMICCAGVIRNADGTLISRLAKKYKDKITPVNFFENPHVFLHTSATVVKKSVFGGQLQFPIGMTRNEDYAFFFALAMLTKVIYCGIPSCMYVGGVEGQATGTPFNTLITHVIKRLNLVHDAWIQSGCKNKVYPVFTKYEIRHMVLNAIRSNDSTTILLIIETLSHDLKRLFPRLELFLYRKRRLRQLATNYIYFTKAKWRSYGYPYVGQI